MKHLIVLFVLAFAVLGISRPGEAAPLFDDTYVVVELQNSVSNPDRTTPADVTYNFGLRSRVFGVNNGDMLRVQLMQNGQKLADIKAALNVIDGVGTTAWSDRDWRRKDPSLTAHGPMTAKLSLKSPTGTETPLRDLSFEVERMWRVDSSHPKAIHSPRYRVIPKDNLGMNWIWLRDPSNTEGRGRVYFYGWAPVDGNRDEFSNPFLQVTRNGQAVPLPRESKHLHESIVEVAAQDIRDLGTGKHTIHDRSWNLIWVKPPLVWGPRNPNASSLLKETYFNISENPGTYVVRLLSSGDLVREWKFEIAADGSFVQHPAQSTFSMRPGAYFMEATFPKENDSQFYFDPAVVKQSTAYGRAWQNVGSLSNFFSTLPGKRGNVSFPKP